MKRLKTNAQIRNAIRAAITCRKKNILLRLLQSHYPDLDNMTSPQSGHTPLTWAIRKYSPEIVALLLQYGASAKHPRSFYYKQQHAQIHPIVIAAAYSQVAGKAESISKIMLLLLNHGAQIPPHNYYLWATAKIYATMWRTTATKTYDKIGRGIKLCHKLATKITNLKQNAFLAPMMIAAQVILSKPHHKKHRLAILIMSVFNTRTNCGHITKFLRLPSTVILGRHDNPRPSPNSTRSQTYKRCSCTITNEHDHDSNPTNNTNRSTSIYHPHKRQRIMPLPLRSALTGDEIPHPFDYTLF